MERFIVVERVVIADRLKSSQVIHITIILKNQNYRFISLFSDEPSPIRNNGRRNRNLYTIQADECEDLCIVPVAQESFLNRKPLK
jgi:hypothetical protein